MKPSPLSVFRSLVDPVFRQPDFVQTAALCLRQGPAGPEVLLVSSLTSKRWILPKGWPMEGRTLAEAALQEAWEEAGVRGRVEPEAMGAFTYRKVVKKTLSIPCRCEVFRVDVDSLADDYPEKTRRQRRWMAPADAAKAVDEPELKALLAALGPA